MASTVIGERRRLVEVISKPFHHETDGVCEPGQTYISPGELRVKVRQVPGEPTTLVEAAVADLQPLPLSTKLRYLHVARVFAEPILVDGMRLGCTLSPDMLRRDDAHLFDHVLHEDGPLHEPPLDEDDRRGLIIPEEGLLVYTASHSEGGGVGVWNLARWKSFSCRVEPILIRDLRGGDQPIIWHYIGGDRPTKKAVTP
jgi:hypothetical protein